LRKIEIVVTDIDYTLTDAQLRLDTRAVEKIRRLEAQGVKVVLMSGRSLPATSALAQLIGTSGLIAAENGGVIARYQKPIRILGRIKNARAALRILKKRMGRMVVERPESKYGMRLSSVTVERSFELEEARKFLRNSRAKVQLIDTGVTFQLSDERVNKGYALVQLARLEKLRLTRTVAIGDNYNDLSLFRKAAYTIAVANAPREVKEQADYACKRAYGEGFLEGIAHVGV
jgi:phosphoglycolate phosphatase (TIGR01487 family)